MSFIGSLFGFGKKRNEVSGLHVEMPVVSEPTEEVKVFDDNSDERKKEIDNDTEDSLDDLKLSPSEFSILTKTLNAERSEVKINKSLLNNPMFIDFFAQNYFSRGRHNGLNFGSETHFEIGKKAIVSDFQGILMKLIDHKRRYMQDIQNESVKNNKSFPHLSKDLDQLITNVQDDVVTLEKQLQESNEGQGWISKSISDYENGYIQGKQYGIKIRLLNAE